MMASKTCFLSFFFFNDTATTEIYTLSLHDALPISKATTHRGVGGIGMEGRLGKRKGSLPLEILSWFWMSVTSRSRVSSRSEEHTSELQSRQYLVCRLLLEKKKKSILRHPVC